MRAIIYFGILTLAFFLQDVCAQAPKLECSEKDVAAVTNYLIASEAGKDAKFPLTLQNQDIFVYSFMSGVHKVMPRGNDSVLLVHLHTNDDPEGSRGVIFQFTVEPQLTRLELEEEDKNWKELLAVRRVTQFHIQEVRKSKRETAYEDLNLVTNPREQRPRHHSHKEGEQAGIGQSAPRPESKSEGGDKARTESEERFR